MRLARVTKVYRNTGQERHATEYNGAYAVDVVFLDSKLADTSETKPGVFLSMHSEDDFSYPDEGTIVGVDTYEGTSISFVDHISPLGKLVPRMLPGQRKIGDEKTGILVDTEQSQIDFEADTVRIDSSDYKNASDSQTSITQAFQVVAQAIIDLHSKGDFDLIADGVLNVEAGRLSLAALENSSITAMQALDIVAGTAFQLITGLDLTLKSQLGKFEAGNLIGKFGVDVTGVLSIENTTTTLKTIIDGIITEVSAIVVANGTGPNVGNLTTLKNQTALLLK